MEIHITYKTDEPLGELTDKEATTIQAALTAATLLNKKIYEVTDDFVLCMATSPELLGKFTKNAIAHAISELLERMTNVMKHEQESR